MHLTSPAFRNGDVIPKQYTSDGENRSPSLSWRDLPPGTQSIALIVDDPDDSHAPFVHWLLYDVPPTVTNLEEGLARAAELPNGGRQGSNGFQQIGYSGPRLPSGTHHDRFHLYALATKLDLHPGASCDVLDGRIKGHVLEETELKGCYGRSLSS